MKERDGRMVETATEARRPPTISRTKAGNCTVTASKRMWSRCLRAKSLMKFWLLSFLSNHDPTVELLTLEMAKAPDQ